MIAPIATCPEPTCPNQGLAMRFDGSWAEPHWTCPSCRIERMWPDDGELNGHIDALRRRLSELNPTAPHGATQNVQD